jgi:hypothetical protein
MKLKHDVFRVYTRWAMIKHQLFLCVFLIAGAIALGNFFREYYIIKPNLLSEGVETNGFYVDRKRTSSGEGGTSYSLTYSYTADELTYNRKHSTNSVSYANTAIGDTVAIRYLPDAPHISRTVDEVNQPSSNRVAVFMLSGAVTLFALLSLLREVAFHLRGQWLDGEIMSISGAWEERSHGPGGSKSIYVITVHYQFVEPHTAKLISNKVKSERDDLKEKSLPAFGTRLVVLYLNQYLYRVL